MDEAAPITWLINQINDVLGNGAATVATALTTLVMPVVTIGVGIFMLLKALNFARGSSEPLMDFIFQLISWSVIIGFGLNTDNYVNAVMPVVTGLGTDLANAVSGGSVTAGAMDQLALFYLDVISKGFEAASATSGLEGLFMEGMVLLKGAIIMLGLIPLLVAAAVTLILANAGAMILAMVGPLFFAFALFPATRAYFSAWINAVFSHALVPLLVAVVGNISIGLSHKMLTTNGQDLTHATFVDLFLAAIGNLVLLFLLRHVVGMASALSAGGIVIQGPRGMLGGAARGVIDSGRATGQAARGIWRSPQAVRDFSNKVRGRFNGISDGGRPPSSPG